MPFLRQNEFYINLVLVLYMLNSIYPATLNVDPQVPHLINTNTQILTTVHLNTHDQHYILSFGITYGNLFTDNAVYLLLSNKCLSHMF